MIEWANTAKAMTATNVILARRMRCLDELLMTVETVNITSRSLDPTILQRSQAIATKHRGEGASLQLPTGPSSHQAAIGGGAWR